MSESIFDRVSLIIRSNVNDLLSRFEDPAKLVDQAISDARAELGKMKMNSLPVIANAKRAASTLEELKAEAAKWHLVATNALAAGNEEDAKNALTKENDIQGRVTTQTAICANATASSDRLIAKLNEMSENIKEMQNKAAQIKATAATAKATSMVNKITGSDPTSSAGASFTRMQDKADQQLAEAEALGDIENDPTADAEKELVNKYATTVFDPEAALKALKKENKTKD